LVSTSFHFCWFTGRLWESFRIVLLFLAKACASFAESCDLRRDYVIELLNVGSIRDAAANSQLGLWCALKCGVLFRMQQFVNINTLIRSCVVQPDFKNDIQHCLDMMRMMYSNESSKNLFGCPMKKSSEVSFSDDLAIEIPFTNVSFSPRTSTPSRSPARVGQKTIAASIMESFEELRLESGKTPPRGRSPGRITSKLIDSFHELTLTETICSLHELSDSCNCSFCELCRTNYNAAFEYWFSSFLYESMSEVGTGDVATSLL
ncbi:hypothetical protein COOONC_14758, partial [Cooperia oncophora]